MTANTTTHTWQYKYLSELNKIKGCPPRTLQNQLTKGYRFAFSDLDNPNNFLPPAILKPSRILPNQVAITDCCTGFSLSMFDSLDTLQKRVRAARKSNPLILKRLGTHYIELEFDATGGRHTLPNATGHFDFFETTTFSCKAAVKSHAPIQL